MVAEKIVVGLDDSAASRAAHRWAAEYAQATGMDLSAIHVLDWPIGLNASSMNPGTRLCVPKQDMAQPYWRGMRRVFDETSSPQGSVLQFAQGDVSDVLVRLSAHAGLLVVGTREPIQGRPYLVGSISHYCISYATCSVVTVPVVPAHSAPNPPVRTAIMTSAPSSPRLRLSRGVSQISNKDVNGHRFSERAEQC